MGAQKSVTVSLPAPIVEIKGKLWWLDEAPTPCELCPGVTVDCKLLYQFVAGLDLSRVDVKIWGVPTATVLFYNEGASMFYCPTTGALATSPDVPITKTKEEVVRLRIDAERTVNTRQLHRKPLGAAVKINHPTIPVAPGTESDKKD